MTQPTIVTNWDSLPPEVSYGGEVFSTRVLHKQYLDALKEIEELKRDQKTLADAVSTPQGAAFESIVRWAFNNNIDKTEQEQLLSEHIKLLPTANKPG